MIPDRPIFSESERKQVADALKRSFRGALVPGERFAVAGELDDERIIVEIELSNSDRTAVTSFFAGRELVRKEETTLIEHRALLVEFLSAMIDEHLREGRWPRPHLEWKEYTFESATVFYRGAARNEALEAEADRILAEADGE